MSNLPTTNSASTSISGPIQPIDRGLADTIGVYRNRLERDRGEMVLRGGLPTADHRQAMMSRLERVGGALRPIRMSDQDKRAASKAITAMLTAWIHQGRGDIRDTVSSFTAHLQDMPLFAIESACRSVAKGYVDGLSPDFPPSAARLHQLALEASAVLQKEVTQIREVLTAKAYHEPTDDERDRVAAGFQTLAADMQTGEDETRRAQREAAGKSLDEANRKMFERECEAEGVDPAGGVSPALLKLINAGMA